MLCCAVLCNVVLSCVVKIIYDFAETVDLTKYEAHAISNLMKAYLRELPESLITWDVAEQLKKHMGMVTLLALTCRIHTYMDSNTNTKINTRNTRPKGEERITR